MSEQIQKLEAAKVAIQQQAAYELGKIDGRIELLKEQAAKEVPAPTQEEKKGESS